MLALIASCFITGCAVPGPDVVLTQAVEAARDGDREAYLECFTARSRPILEMWWRAADANNPPLGVLGAAPVELLSIGRLPSYDFDAERVVMTVREGSQTAAIVAHHIGGMWRIDLIDRPERMSE